MAAPPLALAAAAEAPTNLGLKPLILGDALEGEAREVGKVMGGMALSSRSWGLPSGGPAVLLSRGGFQAIGDLGITGPTLTNLNDIRAILIIGSSPMKLDRIDVNILNALQKNGRMTNVELSEMVNLSPSPCLMRVKRLQAEGYIEGYSARISVRGQRLTEESGFDSRLPFGGSLGRTDWSDGRGMGADWPAFTC